MNESREELLQRYVLATCTENECRLCRTMPCHRTLDQLHAGISLGVKHPDDKPEEYY